MLIKYIKSFLWRVTKRQSYTEDAQYLKVKSKMDLDKLARVRSFQEHFDLRLSEIIPATFYSQ